MTKLQFSALQFTQCSKTHWS